MHLLLLQSVCQLHLTILRISSGAGGTSVCTGIRSSFPSTRVSESRHRGYGTLQQLKWVVEFADEKSKE